MTEHSSTNVLICGAGAAGLTLAVELARRGISFRLIEKLPDPFRGSRGKGIMPRTQEIFEDMGILDRVVASGGAYPLQRTYHDDGSYEDTRVFEVSEPTPGEPYHSPWMVPQFLTEAALRERLTELGHQPEFACELIGLEQDAEQVKATLRGVEGEGTIAVRYLVGTDGGRSFVRHVLKIDFPGKTLGVRAVVADVAATGIDRKFWHRFNEGSMEKQIAFCPLAGTELFQLQGPIPMEGEMDLSAGGLTALVAQRTRRSEIHIESVAWASAFHMSARLAERYRDGRVFLAGDAAHSHPPTGGQGLNTSVQDAYNLGWKLAAVLHGAPDALLESYEQERRPIAADMLGLATKLLNAEKAGSMHRGSEVRQLDLCYPDSALALEKPERQSGLRAGDRAPDAPMRGAGNMPIRLFNLFGGSHWTLLGYEVERLSRVKPRLGLHIHAVGSHGDLIDEGGHFVAGYGLQSGDWILVRPDGYVGAIVSSHHIAELNNHLEQVGLIAK